MAQFLRRHVKWLLLVAIVGLVGTWWGWRQVRGFGDGLKSFAYTSYVSNTYMIAERRRTGKWPLNLEGLPQSIKADRNYKPNPNNDDPLNIALTRHQETFRDFKMMQSDAKSCTYELYLSDHIKTCHSSLNPDKGYCTNKSE